MATRNARNESNITVVSNIETRSNEHLTTLQLAGYLWSNNKLVHFVAPKNKYYLSNVKAFTGGFCRALVRRARG